MEEPSAAAQEIIDRALTARDDLDRRACSDEYYGHFAGYLENLTWFEDDVLVAGYSDVSITEFTERAAQHAADESATN